MVSRRGHSRSFRLLTASVFIAALLTLSFARGFAQGGDIAYGQSVSGALGNVKDAADIWHFSGSVGDVIALAVQRTAGDLEPVLTLTDSTQQPVAGTAAPAGSRTASLGQVRPP